MEPNKSIESEYLNSPKAKPHEKAYAKPYEHLWSPVKTLAHQGKRGANHLPVPPPITPPSSADAHKWSSIYGTSREGHRGTSPYRLHPIPAPSTFPTFEAKRQHGSYAASRYEK